MIKKNGLLFILASIFIFEIIKAPLFAKTKKSQEKIVLLISVDFLKESQYIPKFFFWSKRRISHMNKYLTEEVNEFVKDDKTLKEMFKIEVRVMATQYDLWDVFQNPQNSVLFWLSHAGVQNNVMSQEKSVRIFDYNLFDITDYFLQLPSHLRFIGFINCFGQEAVDTLAEKGQWFVKNPRLRVAAFSEKVDALDGLQEVLKKFNKKVYQTSKGDLLHKIINKIGPHEKKDERWGVYLYARRSCYEETNKSATKYQAVRLHLSGSEYIVTTFDQCREGEAQYKKIFIPESELQHKRELKLVINAGTRPLQAPPLDIHLGEFHFSFESFHGESRFKLMTLGQKKAIGVSRNIYVLKGIQPDSLQRTRLSF
jgi:hypothetical protein